ncbi:MAG TPA: ferredoxin reductase [Gaiellaceae bacterium]|nr:ferredoxin reductase [Gaiellaceae bacterium]
MARAAVLGRLTWRVAEVVDIVDETPRVKTLRLDVDDWPGHLPGQHVDIRLTAEDGYQAQRSYSIASAPASGELELTVELVEDGEVSPYLLEELRAGDRFELRGPVGGYFVWEPARGGPLFLVAGGSGVVPFRSMLRQLVDEGGGVEATLLLSSRTWDDVIYREELAGLDGVRVVHTLTRAQPEGWDGYARRVDLQLLAEVGPAPARMPLVYVCGPTPFVEAVASGLVQLGHDPTAIRTERFGPTGG